MTPKTSSAATAERNAGRLQWHPAFSSAFQIELAEDMEKLIVSTEYQLTRKPLVMDMLIMKKTVSYRCKNEIASFFRGHNIIEYKNPNQSYSLRDFFKTVVYAGTYQSNTQREDEILPDDITVTVVCGRYPRKVINSLKVLYGVKFYRCEAGIYRADRNIIFPVQFVVNPQLDAEKYKWLSRLRDNLTAEKDVEILAKEYKGREKNPLYETAMDVIMRANREAYKEAKDMCQALRELFADELEERENKGRSEGRREGRREGIQEGRKEERDCINQLNQTLLDKGLIEELKKATANPEYQQKLLVQYGIV